jgi:multicomponent Na+:H+ antiporter subunit E
MNFLIWNVLLSLAWGALSGEFTLLNLTLGFAMGFALLFFVAPALGSTNYFSKVGQALSLLLFFMKEVTLANIRVALHVITPSHNIRPGIVAVPLDARTDSEITFVANLIALTPGSLALDLSDDRTVLYVHAMDVTDAESLRHEIKNGFERRVLELLR